MVIVVIVDLFFFFLPFDPLYPFLPPHPPTLALCIYELGVFLFVCFFCF